MLSKFKLPWRFNSVNRFRTYCRLDLFSLVKHKTRPNFFLPFTLHPSPYILWGFPVLLVCFGGRFNVSILSVLFRSYETLTWMCYWTTYVFSTLKPVTISNKVPDLHTLYRGFSSTQLLINRLNVIQLERH